MGGAGRGAGRGGGGGGSEGRGASGEQQPVESNGARGASLGKTGLFPEKNCAVAGCYEALDVKSGCPSGELRSLRREHRSSGCGAVRRPGETCTRWARILTGKCTVPFIGSEGASSQ